MTTAPHNIIPPVRPLPLRPRLREPRLRNGKLGRRALRKKWGVDVHLWTSPWAEQQRWAVYDLNGNLVGYRLFKVKRVAYAYADWRVQWYEAGQKSAAR